MTAPRDWLVLGVSGVTCGGKTTLATRLLGALSPVHVLHQDKYFLPDDSPAHVRVPGLAHNNYDVLSALDMEAMLADARHTLAGQSRAHASCLLDEPHRFKLPGKSFLILEGFTVLNYPPIMELCDLRYYFTLEYSECLSRRVFRLYEPPDVDGYFDKCVWPEHLKHRAQIEKDGRARMIDGSQPHAFDIVMEDLRALQQQQH